MDFRLELHIKSWKETVNLRHKVLLTGSCFTEHISSRLKVYRFPVLENPHGILFNPISILCALKSYVGCKTYTADDLFLHNGIWQSWMHHGRFAAVNPLDALEKMNRETSEASGFLRDTNWVIITLGSAFVYELLPHAGFGSHSAPMVVANCHKVAQPHFRHRLLSYAEVLGTLNEMVDTIHSVNPSARIMFTISPVRHHREGLVENNRSKGLLHLAVYHMLEKDNVHYFPAYELVVDDLRDYRFYAEDLVHPNYLATQYVWEKFVYACIDDESKRLMEKINRLNAAMKHRPRQPESEEHKGFLNKMLQETIALQNEAPYLNLSDYRDFFSV